jgi:hypothetical protein
MQRADRDIELVAVGIFEREELGGHAADLQGLQPQIAPDAVLLVHDRRALGQLGEVAHDGVAVALARTAPTLLAHPLAVELGLGDQGDAAVFQQQAALQRRDGQRQSRSPSMKDCQPSI